MDIFSETARLLRVIGGCFGYTKAIVAFDLKKNSPEAVMSAFRAAYPNYFVGYDCETCGYDYPEFVDNYNADDYEHTHSLETCGREPGYRADEYVGDAIDYLYSGEREVAEEVYQSGLKGGSITPGISFEDWVTADFSEAEYCSFDRLHTVEDIAREDYGLEVYVANPAGGDIKFSLEALPFEG